MNKQLTLVPNTISQKQYCTEKAHLFGSRLVLARIAWVALMMLIIAFFPNAHPGEIRSDTIQ
jgi:hypothetical protein